MSIASLCRHPVVTLERNASLQQAAGLMRDHHVGAVVVTGEVDGRPAVAGVVTDRDLAIEVLARGVAAADVHVGTIARGQLVTVADTADLGEALQTMQRHGVRRLLVTGSGGHLAGIVALDDLLEAIAALCGTLGGVVRSGIEREAAERAPLAPPPAPPHVHVPAMGTAGWTRGAPGRA